MSDTGSGRRNRLFGRPAATPCLPRDEPADAPVRVVIGAPSTGVPALARDFAFADAMLELDEEVAFEEEWEPTVVRPFQSLSAAEEDLVLRESEIREPEIGAGAWVGRSPGSLETLNLQEEEFLAGHLDLEVTESSPSPPPSQRFVPRNQRPVVLRASASPWRWLLSGLFLIGGASGVVWRRIREPEVPPPTPVRSTAVADLAPALPQPPLPSPLAVVVEPLAPLVPPPALAAAPPDPPAVVEPQRAEPAKAAGRAGRLPTSAPERPEGIGTGILFVTAHEPVRVRVDGQWVGIASTTQAIELPEGLHTVVVFGRGRSQTHTVRVAASRPAQVELSSK